MENNYHKFFFKNGYCKIKLFSPRDIKNFLKGVDNRIESLCPNIYKLNKKTKLKNFHKLNLSENLRKKVINPDTRYLKMNKLTTLSASSKKKIFKLMKEFWGHNKYCIYWVGSAKKKQIKQNAIGFRIVRPNEKKDGGSEHIDAYSNDLKAFFTVWIPLTGFSKKQGLKLAPKSHIRPHALNSYLNQKKYISRSFKPSYVKKFKFVRPDLKIGDAIIHHPNIIHGGNINYGDITRVSVEIRIFNKIKFDKKKSFDLSLVN